MRKTLKFLGLILAVLLTSTSAKAVTVYFNNPLEWQNCCAYFYNNSSSNTWPGTAMTKDGNLYKIDVPAAFSTSQVIFTDGTTPGQAAQWPAKDGLQISNQSMICMADKDNGSISSYIWTKYETEAFQVYFDNTVKNWSKPHVHYWGAQGSDWPGADIMTLAEGKHWVATVPAGTAGVIFTNGANSGTEQTANYVATPNHMYDGSRDLGVYEAPAPAGEPFAVYFDNTDFGWATPTVHYWGGSTESDYPGVAMTRDGAYYKYDVPAGTTYVQFNAGGSTSNASANKTPDFQAKANHIYTNEDKGLRSDYVREVELPTALYILGTVGDGVAWATTPGVQMTRVGETNVFKATDVRIFPEVVGGNVGKITLVTAVGDNWNVVNASDRYGASTEDATLTNGTASMKKYPKNVSASSALNWAVAPQTYTVEADFENMEIRLTQTGQEIVAGSGNVSVNDITLAPGADGNIGLYLNSDIDMIGLELTITLPSVVTPGTPLLSSRVSSTHSLSYNHNEATNAIKIEIYSSNNYQIARGGSLLTIPVSVKSTAAEGDYEVNVTDVLAVDLNRLGVEMENSTGTITVEGETTESTLTLNKTQVAIQIGETSQLTATLDPEDSGAVITWRSDNEAVATVSATGLVTGIAKGTANVIASYGDLYATATITVGKTPQEITWNDVPEKMVINSEITFNATSNSGLEVEYVLVGGNGYATLVGNKLTAKGVPGVVTVQARQGGDDEYAPAEPVTKSINIWLGYTMADVDGDNKITVQDATKTVNHILGSTPDGFNASAADMNGDNKINIVDVALIIDAALEYEATHPATPAPRKEIAPDAERFAVSASGYDLRVFFTNQENYIATQFDLTLPEGFEVKSASVAGSTHSVGYLKHNTFTRVAVFDEANATFASDGYITLTLNRPISGNVSIDNALIDSTDGRNIFETEAFGVTSNDPTGISLVGVDAANTSSVYSVDGVCVFSGNAADFRPSHAGVYIVRTGNKVQKVVVR